MNAAERRLHIAQWIVNAEARRDKQGHIRLFKLKPADGGGSYEFAGINDRYHPVELRRIKEAVNQGSHALAEAMAVEHIAEYTNIVMAWKPVPAVEAFLRDSAFNRGPKGALRIMQIALGVADDGKFGPITKAAFEKAQENPEAFLKKLRSAREKYERRVAPPVGARAEFWQGLVNRWNNALEFSKTLL